jgi:GAF domain-containing protein
VTSIALELDECKRVIARLTALHHTVERLHACVRSADVTRVVEDIVVNTIGGRSCAVFAFDDERSRLQLLSARPGEVEIPREVTGEGLVAGAAMSGRLFMNNIGELTDCASWERTLRACVPVRYCDRVIAVIAMFGLDPSKKRFTPLDVELFDLLSRHAGVALNTAAVLERNRGK